MSKSVDRRDPRRTEHKQVEVTEHAALRFQQRAGSVVPFPKERVRELFQEGSPVPADGLDAGDAARQAGELLLVHDGGRRPVIKTVLLAGEAP